VTTNLPGGQAPAASGTQSKSAHNDETVNYEISKTVKNQVRDQGQVQRLSVAVLVDGVTTIGADGAKTYQARSADEMKQLTALVRSAVGYDEKRGDAVDVVNMPFAGVDEPGMRAIPWSVMGLEKDDLIKLGETGVVAIVGLLFLLLVVRPMVVRFIESLPAPPERAAAGSGLLTSPIGAVGGLLAGDPATTMQRAAPTGVGEMIDIGQVEGRVAASSMKKIGEIVEKHPEEAVSIMRSWMYQNNR
jgi:flagellar M-ring protein FliF